MCNKELCYHSKALFLLVAPARLAMISGSLDLCWSVYMTYLPSVTEDGGLPAVLVGYQVATHSSPGIHQVV